MPDDFDAWDAGDAWRILRHELVHVAQFERYGWLLMILVYRLLPAPGRSRLWARAARVGRAYAETLRASAEIGGLEAARDPALHDRITSRFTGPDYGWMWPFPRAVRR